MFLNKEDLGLYEWFEEMDAHFLAAHGLDPNGILYKANRFVWAPLPPDAFTNPDAAESLEVKGNATDPTRLQVVLEAIADDDRPINGIIDRYFSRDNYETWLAVNILFSNWDTISRNFYLYSPADSESPATWRRWSGA